MTTITRQYVSRPCGYCEGAGALFWEDRGTGHEKVCPDCEGSGQTTVRLNRLSDAELEALSAGVWAEQMERHVGSEK